MTSIANKTGVVSASIVLAGIVGYIAVFVPPLFAVVSTSLTGIYLLLLLVKIITRDDSEGRAPLLRWTMAGYGSKALLALVIISVPGAVEYFGPDANRYHSDAMMIVNHWDKGEPMPELSSGKEGFSFLLAGLYTVVGPHRAAGLVFNAMIAAAVIPVMFDTTKRLVGRRANRVVMPLLVLLPAFVVWPAQLLREATIFLAMSIALNAAVRLLHRTSASSGLILVFSLAGLFTLRSQVAFATAVGLVAGLMLAKRKIFRGVAVGLSVWASLGLVVIGLGFGYTGYQLIAKVDLQTVQELRLSGATSASTGFDSQADISTPERAASYLPLGLAQFLLGPFPWQLEGLREKVALLDTVPWWILLMFLWRGMKRFISERGMAISILALPSLGLAASLSLLLSNYGTTIRERPQVMLFLLPLIGLGATLTDEPTQSTAGGLLRRADTEISPRLGTPSANGPESEHAAST